jgi:hypothetical protein
MNWKKNVQATFDNENILIPSIFRFPLVMNIAKHTNISCTPVTLKDSFYGQIDHNE